MVDPVESYCQKSNGLSALEIRVPLQLRETPTSYLSRLSMANGIDHVRTFCLDMGISLQGVVEGAPETLDILAGLGGVEAAMLKHWSIRKLPDRTTSLAGHIMPQLAFAQTRLRVCPHCVKEQADNSGWKAVYFPVEHHVPCVRTCLKHERALFSLPEATYPRSPYDLCNRVADHSSITQPIGQLPRDVA